MNVIFVVYCVISTAGVFRSVEFNEWIACNAWQSIDEWSNEIGVYFTFWYELVIVFTIIPHLNTIDRSHRLLFVFNCFGSLSLDIATCSWWLLLFTGVAVSVWQWVCIVYFCFFFSFLHTDLHDSVQFFYENSEFQL